MKIIVKLTRIYEESCELEVSDLQDAKTQIESLVNDDFREDDSHYQLQIIDESGKNIEGDIQPYTPKIGV